MNQVTFKNSCGETLTVKIGAVVNFKDDVEQCGRVTKIAPAPRGGYTLTVSVGDDTTLVHSSEVWME